MRGNQSNPRGWQSADSRSPGFIALAVSLGFAVLVLRTAWLSDDAFITLRTVDHFVHGRGLVWNLGERVQVFTHPLWMFFLSGLYWGTGDAQMTLFGAGFVATAAFLGVLVKSCGAHRWTLVVVLLIACGSKALVEYSTSGLENPLTHLLVAATYLVHLGSKAPHERLGRVTFLSSLVALNRLDAVLLVAPAVAWDAWRSLPSLGARTVLVRIGLGLSLFLLWECFSVVYYGVPFPNTAYAKLTTGLDRSWYLQQGLAFWWETARVDPVTVLGVFLGMAVAWKSKMPSVFAALALHAVYVVWIGGDFMVGRFLTPELALALVALGYGLRLGARLGPAMATVGLFACLGLGLLQPYSPIAAGLDYPGSSDFKWELASGVNDERAYYFPFTGLLRNHDTKGVALHPWARAGRAAGERVLAGGADASPTVRKTIGFYGYYAAPELHVIDPLALSDALLARMPVAEHLAFWIGHFPREIPDGYLESLRTGENRITDPQTAELYGTIKTVIRGPLWSRERWRAIWKLNARF